MCVCVPGFPDGPVLRHQQGVSHPHGLHLGPHQARLRLWLRATGDCVWGAEIPQRQVLSFFVAPQKSKEISLPEILTFYFFK